MCTMHFLVVLTIALLSPCFRDDRCVGDNGREGWFPYLAEEVVGLLQSMPISHVSHSAERGIDHKLCARRALLN
jgi:hypothetical protein